MNTFTFIISIILALVSIWLLTSMLTFFNVIRRPILPVLILGFESEIYCKWWNTTWVKPHRSNWRRG